MKTNSEKLKSDFQMVIDQLRERIAEVLDVDDCTESLLGTSVDVQLHALCGIFLEAVEQMDDELIKKREEELTELEFRRRENKQLRAKMKVLQPSFDAGERYGRLSEMEKNFLLKEINVNKR